LCWRAGRQGWRVLYEPAGQVTHVQGVSADTRPYRMILAHHRSLLRFAWLSDGGLRRALFPVVAAGVGARAVAACVAKWHDGRIGAPAPPAAVPSLPGSRWRPGASQDREGVD